MRVLPALACSWLCALTGIGWSIADQPAAIEVDRFVTASAPSMGERRFTELVLVRAQAIDTALGPLLEGACTSVRIEFARRSQETYPRAAYASYDPSRHVLTFRRELIDDVEYDFTSYARSYWPYYQDGTLRAFKPVIGVIDEALWTAHMREAAHQRDLAWPPAECGSLRLSDRLGCQMLIAGISASLSPPQPQIFNMNRIDLLWPEKLGDLRGVARDDDIYKDVRRLGGILLLRPLVARFGVTRVLHYVAQHPFRIENDNVRASALHYQELAQRELESGAIN